MRKNQRGFSLIELLVVIAIIALLVSILLPALGAARRAARLAVCQSNLRQFATAQYSYGADFKNFIGAFNGSVTATNLSQLDGYHRNAFPSQSNCSEQAYEIVKRYDSWAAAQSNGLFSYYGEQVGSNISTITEQHQHLVLAAYFGETVNMPTAVCPEDRARETWRKAGPKNMIVPAQTSPYSPPSVLGQTMRWYAFASSYQLLPAGWLIDRPVPLPGTTLQQMFNQSTISHDKYSYQLKADKFGGRTLADVVHPAGKVAIADSQQRHHGKSDLYYAFPEAQQPLMFWDGSVRMKITGDANQGWNRHDPDGKPIEFNYTPTLTYESPPPAGEKSRVKPYYKWTRGGLKGIDYGGGEINTSTW